MAVDVKKIRLRNPVKEVRIVVPSRIGGRNWLPKEAIESVLKAADDEKKVYSLLRFLMPASGVGKLSKHE